MLSNVSNVSNVHMVPPTNPPKTTLHLFWGGDSLITAPSWMGAEPCPNVSGSVIHRQPLQLIFFYLGSCFSRRIEHITGVVEMILKIVV